MPVVLVSIYRLEPETSAFLELQRAFKRYGWDMLLWTNWNKGDPLVPSLPLVSNENEASWYGSYPVEVSSEHSEVWERFSLRLQEIYGKVDSAYNPKRCESVAEIVLDAVKPDLFICWCGMSPLFGIPLAKAKSRGIPTLIWEAGMLSNTFLLDPRGIACDASIAGLPLVKQPALDRIQFAQEIMEKRRRSMMSPAILDELFEKGAAKRKKILLLGGMDVANGVYRPDNEATTTLGALISGVELAKRLAEFFPEMSVVYRPHPREGKKPLSVLRYTKIVIDSDTEIIRQFCWADVVVGYGSKLDMDVLTLGKPLVVVGHTAFKGKNLGFEAHDDLSLRWAVASAFAMGVTEEQYKSRISFFAYQYDEACYARTSEASCHQTLTDLARTATLYVETRPQSLNPLPNLQDVLSDAGLSKYRHIQNVTRVLSRRVSEGWSLDEDLNNREYKVAVLDFDLTLFRANSTELFLEDSFPKLLTHTLLRLLESGIRLAGRYNPKPNQYKDYFRVGLIMIVAPWNLLTWRYKRKALAERYLDIRMLENVNKYDRRVVIISCGFGILIKPIVRSMSEKVEVICSNLLAPSMDVRHIGKLAIVRKLVPDVKLENIITVSDSSEDIDLLVPTRGHLVEPKNLAIKTAKKIYWPFRYAADKYGRSWLWNQILRRDLLIILIAFATDWRSLLYLPLLYFALICIYEIGYFENDHYASKDEVQPTISDAAKKYSKYSIEPNAWVGAAICSLPLLFFSEDISYNPLSTWCASLLVLRAIFYIYNRTHTVNRGYIYPWLQVSKYFSYIVVFAPTKLGLVLVFTQISKMVIVYWIYRSGGDKKRVSTGKIGGTLFSIGIVVLLSISKIEWGLIECIQLLVCFSVLFDSKIASIIRWIYRKIRKGLGRKSFTMNSLW